MNIDSNHLNSINSDTFLTESQESLFDSQFYLNEPIFPLLLEISRNSGENLQNNQGDASSSNKRKFLVEKKDEKKAINKKRGRA